MDSSELEAKYDSEPEVIEVKTKQLQAKRKTSEEGTKQKPKTSKKGRTDQTSESSSSRSYAASLVNRKEIGLEGLKRIATQNIEASVSFTPFSSAFDPTTTVSDIEKLFRTLPFVLPSSFNKTNWKHCLSKHAPLTLFSKDSFPLTTTFNGTEVARGEALCHTDEKQQVVFSSTAFYRPVTVESGELVQWAKSNIGEMIVNENLLGRSCLDSSDIKEESLFGLVNSDLVWKVTAKGGYSVPFHCDSVPAAALLKSGTKIWVAWKAGSDECFRKEPTAKKMTIKSIQNKLGLCWCVQYPGEVVFLQGHTAHATFSISDCELHSIQLFPRPLLADHQSFWSFIQWKEPTVTPEMCRRLIEFSNNRRNKSSNSNSSSASHDSTSVVIATPNEAPAPLPPSSTSSSSSSFSSNSLDQPPTAAVDFVELMASPRSPLSFSQPSNSSYPASLAPPSNTSLLAPSQGSPSLSLSQVSPFFASPSLSFPLAQISSSPLFHVTDFTDPSSIPTSPTSGSTSNTSALNAHASTSTWGSYFAPPTRPFVKARGRPKATTVGASGVATRWKRLSTQLAVHALDNKESFLILRRTAAGNFMQSLIDSSGAEVRLDDGDFERRVFELNKKAVGFMEEQRARKATVAAHGEQQPTEQISATQFASIQQQMAKMQHEMEMMREKLRDQSTVIEL